MHHANLDYKWHPQPSSLRLATQAAKLARIDGSKVLDCFCGTGTLLVAAIRAGAEKAIGSDIEDWSQYLRPQLKEMMKYSLLGSRIELHWRVDAFEAVERFDHDILFTDPPGPWEIIGGVLISVKRDLGINGNELRKFWEKRLSDGNWINKKHRTVANVIKLFRTEIERGKRVVANLFAQNPWRGTNRSLARVLAPVFDLRHLVGNWYEVRLK